MKSKLTKLLKAGAIAAAFAALPLSAVTITATLTPSTTTLSVGNTFTVQVFAQNLGAGDLSGFGFHVDPLNALTIIGFTGYTIGGTFADVGFAFGAGPKDIVGAYLGTGNANQNVLLATLNFTALATGTNTLFIQGINDGIEFGLFYGDNTHANLNADVQGSLAITVGGGGGNTGVPDSGTSLALSSLGLLSLALVRRLRMFAC